MKKITILLVFLFSITNVQAQFLNEIYKDFLKYGTVYAAGDISNSYETSEKSYFVRTNPDGSIYSIPDVVDGTNYSPFDYRIGIGIRKLARFDYEVKGTNFYDGTENQIALDAPTAAINGFEYLFHYEKERQRGDVFTNHRFFLRHTGKYHIAKMESREEGNVGFKYSSAEVRGRLPIGKKFSISAGAIYRTHDQAFGYNPIEIWLNELNEDGSPANPWYTLGYLNEFTDHLITSTDADGNTTQDWVWKDSEGNIVAHTDLEFRESCVPHMMNLYNNEAYSLLSTFGEVAPVVGFDFYHYKNNFWVHAYGNVILPYHKYIKGDEGVSYLNRNNWGKGGLMQDTELEQWTDIQGGLMFGWKVSKSLGIFVEGEYAQMWDKELFNTTFGFNYTFR